MPRLLVVHHTTSPTLQAMLEAALSGARDPAIEGVEVVAVPALAATAHTALGADGFLLGTPANIGYMSGALKTFFDLVYYPLLDFTVGRPYGCYVHGNLDTVGAVRSVDAIAHGLRWRKAAEHVELVGEPTKGGLEACRNLGGTLAALLAET